MNGDLIFPLDHRFFSDSKFRRLRRWCEKRPKPGPPQWVRRESFVSLQSMITSIGKPSLVASPVFQGALFKGLMNPIQRGDHFWKSNRGQPQKDGVANLVRSDTDGQGSSSMRSDGSL